MSRSIPVALLAGRTATAAVRARALLGKPVLLAALGIGPVLALRPARVVRCDAAAAATVTMPRKGTMTTSTPDITVPTTRAARVKSALLSLVRLLELLLVFVPPIVTSPLLFFAGQGRHLWRLTLVWSLNEAGPTFQKLGQWASTRPDLFGAATRADFEAFHSEIRPEPWHVTLRTIEDAIKPSRLNDVFQSLDHTPVGAGCVAQVLRGRLVGSKQLVAVKVRRHNVEDMITRDVRLLTSVAWLLERSHKFFRWLAVYEQAENFSTFLLSQLDLRVEGRHLVEFAKRFEHNHDVSFPAPLLAFKSMLVETFEPGVVLTKLLALDKAGVHDPMSDRLPEGLRQAIGRAGVHAFLQMCIVDNFTHSDLHPGNMIVVTEPPFDLAHPLRPVKFKKLVLIDAGLITVLSPADQKNFVDLFIAVAKGDGKQAAQLMAERSREPSTVVDMPGFVREMTSLVESVQLSSFRLDKVQIGKVLERVIFLVNTHHVLLDPAFTSMLTAIVVLEGVGRQLTPDLDIFKTSLPIIARADLVYKKAVAQAVGHSLMRRTSTT